MAEEPSPLDSLRDCAHKISMSVVECCDFLLQEAGRKFEDPSIRLAQDRLKEFATSLGELGHIGDSARETFTRKVESLEGKLQKIQDSLRELEDCVHPSKAWGILGELVPDGAFEDNRREIQDLCRQLEDSNPSSKGLKVLGEINRACCKFLVTSLEGKLQEVRGQFAQDRLQKVSTSLGEFSEATKQELNRQSRNHRLDAPGDHYCKILWRLRHDVLLLPEGSGVIVAAAYRAMAMILQVFIALAALTDAAPSLVKKRREEDYAVYRGLFVAVNPDAHQVWLAFQDFLATIDCLHLSAWLNGNHVALLGWLAEVWREFSRHYAFYRFFEVLAHMRAWGSSEYEHMPEADRASFRAIVAGRELFNYVEDCKRDMLRTGVDVPAEWLQLCYAAHLDVGSPLPQVERDHLGRILDAMYPMLSRFDPYAYIAPPLQPISTIAAATSGGTPDQVVGNDGSAPLPAAKIEQKAGSGRGNMADPDLQRKFMEMAVEEARKSTPEDDRVHPMVGVVVVKNGEVLATAYRGELAEGDHAEFTAMEKKLRDATVAGATVYTTLEPCTNRNHPKRPCADRLIERKVKRVVIGMHDPNRTVYGGGWARLQEAGIATADFDGDLKDEIKDMNREFIRHHTNAADRGDES